MGRRPQQAEFSGPRRKRNLSRISSSWGRLVLGKRFRQGPDPRYGAGPRPTGLRHVRRVGHAEKTSTACTRTSAKRGVHCRQLASPTPVGRRRLDRKRTPNVPLSKTPPSLARTGSSTCTNLTRNTRVRTIPLSLGQTRKSTRGLTGRHWLPVQSKCRQLIHGR